ncbi:MAG: transposase [Nitrososphaerota archaeon]
MSTQICPECGGSMTYDLSTKHFTCKRCGLYVTREQLYELKAKARERVIDDKKKRKQMQDDYLEWWLSSKQH